jgi:putative transposase
MSKYKKLSHVVYKCDYHIVWVPKYRFRILKDAVKDMVDKDIRLLCEWKGCDVEELNVQEDHVHLMVSIPPKVSVSVLMGTLKGKLAIKLFKSYPGLKKKPYWGNHFWARGYFVSTIGLNEDVIRRYVKYQENEERKEENQGRDFGLFEST